MVMLKFVGFEINASKADHADVLITAVLVTANNSLLRNNSV